MLKPVIALLALVPVVGTDQHLLSQAELTRPIPHQYFEQDCNGVDTSLRNPGGNLCFVDRWYSAQLAAAHEPSLYLASREPASRAQGVLRFVWLRTFHHPITVRVDGIDGASPRLVAKQMSGAGGYAPGMIEKGVERPLSRDEAARLRTAIARAGVFTARKDGAGCDGAEWIFEGVDARGYHFASQWSPEDGGVRTLGLAMLALTRWDVGEVY